MLSRSFRDKKRDFSRPLVVQERVCGKSMSMYESGRSKVTMDRCVCAITHRTYVLLHNTVAVRIDACVQVEGETVPEGDRKKDECNDRPRRERKDDVRVKCRSTIPEIIPEGRRGVHRRVPNLGTATMALIFCRCCHVGADRQNSAGLYEAGRSGSVH